MASSKSISSKNKKTNKKNTLKAKVQFKGSCNTNTLTNMSDYPIAPYMHSAKKSFDYLVVYDFEDF